MSAKLKTSFSVKPCISVPIRPTFSSRVSMEMLSVSTSGSNRQMTASYPNVSERALNVPIRSSNGGTPVSSPSSP